MWIYKGLINENCTVKAKSNREKFVESFSDIDSRQSYALGIVIREGLDGEEGKEKCIGQHLCYVEYYEVSQRVLWFRAFKFDSKFGDGAHRYIDHH